MTAPRRKPTRAKALGVSDDDYARLLAAQGGHCALCPATPKTRRLHVDHDHRTGRIRGLLCHSCNRRLWTGATAEWLTRAAAYVEPEARVTYYDPRTVVDMRRNLTANYAALRDRLREAL
jgi:hypothetical protein